MSYCLNPSCSSPKNPDKTEVCQSCGAKILMRDRYKGIKSLGQGGFGMTFLAIDMSLPGNPPCVIKQLRPSTDDPQVFQMAKELFEREAETLGKIGNHPQVPRLLDYFEYNKYFYLVQEYVKGNNLQQEIKKNGPLSEAGARQFLSEILPMIQYIHSQEVIHRDIKPANLIRREQDKKIVLIDFGAVKNKVNPQAAANTSDQTALTSFAIGTPGFAPPEQMALRPVYSSDVYALGVTCIYLLTGKSPKELDYNQKTGEMEWRKEMDISDKFAKVLQKMLEVSVRHRYKTADEVLRAMELEAYEDQLQQGLITPNQSNQGSTNLSNSGRNANSGDSTSGRSKPVSASQKLAEQLRRRRDRNKRGGAGMGGYSSYSPGMGGAGLSGRGSQLPDSGDIMNTAGRPAKKRKVVRLDEKTVLDGYVKGRRDFAQQNLSQLDLSEADLSGGIFHESKLRRTNLQKAILVKADFGKSSLVKANLRNANLVRAYFSGADLEEADLRGADLSHANFSQANLNKANLCGANLTGAKITEQQLAVAKTNWSTVMPEGRKGFW
ncbi:serine/threonine-protein kinase [Spirulina sp. 06S082]|uniref:serine/threonine-protein kinase n=1 Tax=Spirulina sp. 06S082 TaxID=3110248 RepID=UPI002B210414|nr:serine/threonine-protein kinase [Spirulina sp. 06S082]MEA5471221.1 serine/threonine-protein kinase [Spirulina sp. 06S082]